MAETLIPKKPGQIGLLIPTNEAKSLLTDRIADGEKLLLATLKNADELETAEYKRQDWHDHNILLLSRIFNNNHLSDIYSFERFWDYSDRVRSQEESLGHAVQVYNSTIRSRVAHLQALLNRLYLYPVHKSADAPETPTIHAAQQTNIFIGHGHSLVWYVLKDFIQDTLHLPVDEYNLVPTPGISTKERLQDMLTFAAFAFLVMTAEDEHADTTLHARENVIHETGLFQGRLGFEKAIVLREDGCQDFSNMDGIGEIRFPKGDLKARFEQIRTVLQREGILPSP